MADTQSQGPIVPIDPAGEIRVLVLDPGSQDDLLKGRFEVVTFDPDTGCPIVGSSEWEAISYVWGGQQPSELIKVDDSQRFVTPNVVSILKDLRRPNQSRHLWIDGICINQDDPYEKPQQVAIMLQVYQSAKSVIIWLQEHGTEIQAALAAAKWLKDISFSRQESTLSTSDSLRKCFDSYCRSKGMIFKESRPVIRLLSNAWFTRVWVLQEAAVAGELFVYMARELVPWDMLVNLAFRFAAESPSARDDLKNSLADCYRKCMRTVAETEAGRGVSMIYFVQRLRNLRQSSVRMLPPSELVYIAVGRRATVPHDMIYGMNGLFRLWATHFPIEVDYTSLTAAEVFQEFTVHCIDHEQNLDVLGQIRFRRRAAEVSQTDTGRSLPSWSVDWSSEQSNWYQQATPPADALEPPFTGPTSSPYEVLCDRRGRVLRLRGFIVDEFATNPNPGEPPQISEERLAEANRLPRLWRDGDKPNTMTDLGDKYIPHRTKSGGVVFTFGYESFSDAVICYLIGGRHPVVLRRVGRMRAGSEQYFCLEFGTCIVEGFEDGKGVEKALELGLEVEDILII